MGRPELGRVFGEIWDQEEYLKRKDELDMYLLVSIGMQTQFSPPTPHGVMESLPGPSKEAPLTVELHETIRELIFSNPWYGAKGHEMIEGYIVRALGEERIAMVEPYPEDGRCWQLTERGERILEAKLEQHEQDPEQYPLIPDILENIRIANTT